MHAVGIAVTAVILVLGVGSALGNSYGGGYGESSYYGYPSSGYGMYGGGGYSGYGHGYGKGHKKGGGMTRAIYYPVPMPVGYGGGGAAAGGPALPLMAGTLTAMDATNTGLFGGQNEGLLLCEYKTLEIL